MNAEQLEALRAEMQFVNDAALSFHKGEEGKARALNVIATRSSVALNLLPEIIGLFEQLHCIEPISVAIGESCGECPPCLARAALRSLEEQFEALETAARQLYERVEMDESVGICLSSRVEALTLGSVLSNPTSSPPDDSLMLHHMDGTPYMDVFDYMESRGDPP